jgi:hypothetical protein
MSRAFFRFSRHADRWQPSSGCVPPRTTRAEFYREEFLKHQRCLDRHREYFSEQAIHDVEHALQKILARLDALCRHQDCDEVISAMLKKFDLVTRLSTWDDRGRIH